MNNIYLKSTRVKNFTLDCVASTEATKSSGPEHKSTLEETKAKEILDVVTELVFSDDITIGKLRLAAHALVSGFSVDSYSNKEIAQLVGKSERTARSIRAWAGGVNAFNEPCKKKVAACSEFLSELKSSFNSTNNKHKENKFLSKEMELVLTHLGAIGFNSFEGEITVPRRSARTIAWIDRWGVDSVLHAVWIADGPRGATRNKAGFVRTLVESGLQAPEGWSHPELGSSEPFNKPEVFEEEQVNPISTLPLPPTPAPSSGPENELVASALRDSIRPTMYRTWFEDLRFTGVDSTLICWCPTIAHLTAIEGPYYRIMDNVLKGLGLTVAEFQVGRDDSHELPRVAEPQIQSVVSMSEPAIDCTHETIMIELKRAVRPSAFRGWFEILRFTKTNDRTICWSPSRSHLAVILAGRLGSDLQRVLSGLDINEFGFGVGDADAKNSGRTTTQIRE